MCNHKNVKKIQIYTNKMNNYLNGRKKREWPFVKMFLGQKGVYITSQTKKWIWEYKVWVNVFLDLSRLFFLRWTMTHSLKSSELFTIDCWNIYWSAIIMILYIVELEKMINESVWYSKQIRIDCTKCFA